MESLTGSPPPKKESFHHKAKEDSCAGGLEGEQASDFEEDEDGSTSDEDVPGLGRPLDEAEAFLQTCGQGHGADNVGSATTDPSTPEPKSPLRVPQVLVGKAIAAIMKEMSPRREYPKRWRCF